MKSPVDERMEAIAAREVYIGEDKVQHSLKEELWTWDTLQLFSPIGTVTDRAKNKRLRSAQNSHWWWFYCVLTWKKGKRTTFQHVWKLGKKSLNPTETQN